jgi:hypothetical protein
VPIDAALLLSTLGCLARLRDGGIPVETLAHQILARVALQVSIARSAIARNHAVLLRARLVALVIVDASVRIWPLRAARPARAARGPRLRHVSLGPCSPVDVDG